MQRLVGSDGEHAALHDLIETDLADFGQAARQNLPIKTAQTQLLMTHGNGLNSGIWAATTAHLQNEFHCWGLDFRGHGAARTTNPEIDVERSVLATEISAAVEYLRSHDQPATTCGRTDGGVGNGTSTAPVVGIGHSLGAACMLMAEIATPGTFSALWLYEPVLFPLDIERPESPTPLIEATRRRRIHFDSTQDAFDRLISKPPFSNCDPAAVRAYIDLGTYPVDTGGVVLSCSIETEISGYEAIKPMDFGLLKTVLCPTMVARGGSPDEYNEYPPQIAEPIIAELPNAELVTFSNLNHFGPMEDGAKAAASIKSFLAGRFS